MTLKAITDACNGRYYGPLSKIDNIVYNITTDSREAKEGSLFVAIAGERTDGHQYIDSVYEKGALCCITEKELDGEIRPYIKVESSLQAVKDIAELYRTELDVKVIGITGSVGKTSTKETVAACLSQKYTTLKTLGNFNNELGVPLTVFRLREEDQIAVLEMGISDFGEMTRLTKITKPDICIITNIGQCHLENLKTRDGILKAKTEIFTSMSNNGEVILNGDDDKLVTVTDVKGKKPHFFGINNQCEYYADNIESLGLDGTRCTIHHNNESIVVTIPIPGHHMVYNALAATAAGVLCGMELTQIKAGIESLESLSGRNNIIHENGYTIIDDCYNANPASMKASVDVLDMANTRKVAILGDMFELGENEVRLHRDVGEHISGKSIDILITAGKLAKNIASAVSNNTTKIYSFDSRDELINALGGIINKGDTILVKASHGMEFSKVVEVLKTI